MSWTIRLIIGLTLAACISNSGEVTCNGDDWNVYVSALATAPANATDILVADGTKQAPFTTLAQARDSIRALRKQGTLSETQRVTVWIGPGNYRLEKSFELTSQDSGQALAPVVYRAERPGSARIQGGVSLDGETFRPVKDPAVLERLHPQVRDKVLVCDLSTLVTEPFESFKPSYRGVPASPWLYVNEHPMTLARWPNEDEADGGWATFNTVIDTGLPDAAAADPQRREARGGAFEFDDPRPRRWKLDQGVWLFGYWTHDWSDEVIRIASYDEAEKVITLAAPHNYGIKAGTWGAADRRFFALNALEELDAAGEWYLDRAAKQLYFYPNAELDSAQIVLATLTEPLLKATGLKHAAFHGLVFEYGHAGGIELRDAQQVEIAGCTVANLAGTGISVDGSNNTVRSCDLYHLGTTGLSLAGGDRQALAAANNIAINNHIHHYGLFQRTYAPGIRVQGCGQIVENNRIHDAPHNAVHYGGNEHRFERNEVFRVVMETGDAGAFYTGRDWTSQGNVLRHNFIHNLGGGDASHVNTMGVYLDDCDSGDTIEGNVFYRAGRAIMIGGGRNNPVINNLVIDCPIGLHLDARGMTWKQWNNPNEASWHLEAKAERLNYKQPPWSTQYPKLASIMDDSPREPLDNPIARNVFVDCTKQVCNFDANVRKLLGKLEISDNLAIQTLGLNEGAVLVKDIPGFRNLTGSVDQPIVIGFSDASSENFSLQPSARLFQELPSFEAIPFAKIGLFVDEYRTALP